MKIIITIKDIEILVNEYFGVEIMSRTTLEKVSKPRQLAFYLVSTQTVYNMEDSAKYFKRNHGTISHGVNAMRDMIEVYPAWQRCYNDLVENITTAY